MHGDSKSTLSAAVVQVKLLFVQEDLRMVGVEVGRIDKMLCFHFKSFQLNPLSGYCGSLAKYCH